MRPHALAGPALALLAPLLGGAPQGPAEPPPPVLLYRHAEVAPGRQAEAADLWARFGTHFGAHYPQRVHGMVTDGVLRVLIAFEGYAEAEATLAALEKDEGWQALTEQSRGRFAEDTRVLLFFVGGRPFEPRGKLRFLRVTRSPHSAVPLARAFAKRLSDHLDATYPGLHVSTYSADVHDPSAIYWIFEYADHAAFEAVRLRLLEDERYLALHDGAGGLFHDARTTEERIDR